MPHPGLQVVTRYTSIPRVRIWIGHHYCMSMLSCQYNVPKRPGDLDLLTLKVVSKSPVRLSTLVLILVLIGLSVLELGTMYATDRRQTKALLIASAY